MKRIPYGISSFETVKTENYYFIDKTKYIETLENYGSKYLFFLRPRRFGKSLFVSMLRHYYDINHREEFDKLFGDTYIGKNPTKLRNTYLVLHLNFSGISTAGSLEEIQHSFRLHVSENLISFIESYNLDKSLIAKINNEDKPGDMLTLMKRELKKQQKGIYLIIDEYDNFANNILAEHGHSTYQTITHAGGFLRNFFTNIKYLTDNREIDRLFITGVSPLVMADVTSGFNIGDNISQDAMLSSMVGFTKNEISDLIGYYQAFNIFDKKTEKIFSDFELWYNSYAFNKNIVKIYNTVSVLYYINKAIANKEVPLNKIDENLRTDYGKFRFLLTENNKLNGNFSILRQILDNGEISDQFVRSFALNEIIEKQKFVSMLFYLGFLSFKSFSPLGLFTYSVPNKLVKTLMWEFIQKSLTEVYDLKIDRHFLANAFRNMSENGEWKPVLEHILARFYEAVSFRDFVFHEEGIKMFVLAWLNLAIYYKIYSEKELEQGYSDIYMEPELSYGDAIKYGFIIEMKYIKAAELKSKQKAETAIKKAVEQATTQLNDYKNIEGYGTKKIIIVASAKKLLFMDEVKT